MTQITDRVEAVLLVRQIIVINVHNLNNHMAQHPLGRTNSGKYRCIKISQIKQKFAELRFYFTGPTNSITVDNIVKLAELACKNTCQYCGKGGKQNTTANHYIRIICDKCLNETI